jgi:hypothetical protein
MTTVWCSMQRTTLLLAVYQVFLSLFTCPPRRKKLAEATSLPAEAQGQKFDLAEAEEEDMEGAYLPEIDPDKQEYNDRTAQKHVLKALDLMALKKVIPRTMTSRMGVLLYLRYAYTSTLFKHDSTDIFM